MGKAERDGLEFRPGEPGLKDGAAYGLMASLFLREGSLSRNTATREVRATNLSTSHLTVSGLWTPGTLAASKSKRGTERRRPVPRKKKQQFASSVGRGP